MASQEQHRLRGAASASWTPAVDNRATAVIKVKFSRRDCAACVDRAACAGPDADRRLSSDFLECLYCTAENDLVTILRLAAALSPEQRAQAADMLGAMLEAGETAQS